MVHVREHHVNTALFLFVGITAFNCKIGERYNVLVLKLLQDLDLTDRCNGDLKNDNIKPHIISLSHLPNLRLPFHCASRFVLKQQRLLLLCELLYVPHLENKQFILCHGTMTHKECLPKRSFTEFLLQLVIAEL